MRLPRLLLATSLLAGFGCGRAATTTSTSAAPAMPTGVTALMIASGDSMFNAGSCQRCHGQKGVGATNGPSFITGPWLQHSGSYDEIVRTITTGVPRTAIKDSTHRFQMNPRGGPMNLNDDQVKAVAAYVWSIARGKR
jgi:mono/diheme cytochrome c family protein